MPTFQHGSTSLHYTLHGPDDGPAVLALAPGGLRSAADRWAATPFDPRTQLAGYRVVAMDQRNAGRSTGPIEPDHGWPTYTADQLALLDHLGIEEVSLVGMCIGGPYIMGRVRAAAHRVRAAVMFQPIGLHDNRQAFYDLFDGWRAEQAAAHPEATPEGWGAFREAMFGGDFLFGTTREEAAACTTPVLLFMGDDAYHPAPISRELAELLPNATFVERWKPESLHEATADRVRSFLAQPG